MTEYPRCRKCEASHGMGVEEMATGKITPIDLCHKCLWDGFIAGTLEEQIVLGENNGQNDSRNREDDQKRFEEGREKA